MHSLTDELSNFMIIVGAINCQSTKATYSDPQPDIDQYETVCQIVDNFQSLALPRSVLHVVPPSRANFYGGTKVGFTLDYKHSYYPWIDSSIIEALEDFMNVLPFENAVLYSAGASCIIEWYLTDNIEQADVLAEPSKYPHIYRTAYGRIDDLDKVLPSHDFIM